MSGVFNFTEWFDYQKMADLAAFVAKLAPHSDCVAIGIAEYDSCADVNGLYRLELPTISISSVNGAAISRKDQLELAKYIMNAANTIVAGQKVDYITDSSNPVLAFGIENDEDYIGVIFVVVRTPSLELGLVKQAELIEDIEEKLCEMLLEGSEQCDPKEDPYTSWYYGTLFGGTVFDTQE